VLLGKSPSGKDAISKSMHKTIEHAAEVQEAYDLEANGLKSEGSRNRAEWARMMAVEMNNKGMARTKRCRRRLPHTPTRPSLFSTWRRLKHPWIESRLLLQSGTDVAAMALDAANSIHVANSRRDG
jgi:hypothetical protein